MITPRVSKIGYINAGVFVDLIPTYKKRVPTIRM
jgi:hypothetical protein